MGNLSKAKSKYNKKTNTLEINISKEYFKGLKAPNTAFANAAKLAVKDIEDHFRITKDAWPLDYSFYITEVFYLATGHHLENYLLKELFKKKGYILKSSKKPGRGLVIDKILTKVKRARSNSKTK